MYALLQPLIGRRRTIENIFRIAQLSSCFESCGRVQREIRRRLTTRPSRDLRTISNRFPLRHPRYTKYRPRQSMRRTSRNPLFRSCRSPSRHVMLRPLLMLLPTLTLTVTDLADTGSAPGATRRNSAAIGPIKKRNRMQLSPVGWSIGRHYRRSNWQLGVPCRTDRAPDSTRRLLLRA